MSRPTRHRAIVTIIVVIVFELLVGIHDAYELLRIHYEPQEASTRRDDVLFAIRSDRISHSIYPADTRGPFREA